MPSHKIDKTDMSSADEYSPIMSDNESLSSKRDELQSENYWLGKMFFRYIMARQLLQGSTQAQSWIELDSEQERKIYEYPWRNNLRILEDLIVDLPDFDFQYPTDAHDHSQLLLTLMGSMLRSSDSQYERLVQQSIRDCCGEDNAAYIGQTLRSSAKGLAMDDTIRPGSSISFADQKESLFSFAVALKEHCDKIGIIPNFQVSKIRHQPPLFHAELKLRGHVFTGKGGSKKAAQHTASKVACEQLNLHVPRE